MTELDLLAGVLAGTVTHLSYSVSDSELNPGAIQTYRSEFTVPRGWQAKELAELVLASDWLAQRDRRVAAAALREAESEARKWEGMFRRCLDSENHAQADLADAESALTAVRAVADELVDSIRCGLHCGPDGKRSSYCSACEDSTEDHDCPPREDCEHTVPYRKALALRSVLPTPTSLDGSAVTTKGETHA